MYTNLTQLPSGDIQLPPRQGMAGCRVMKDEVQAITEHQLLKLGWWLDEESGCLVGIRPNPSGEYLVSDSIHVIRINPDHANVSVYHNAVRTFLLKYPVLDNE